ncbi:hypothetical protein GF386_06035 [Candidatus Pacearchaeota archaeon]|nr:hypothetical protein [Candidatus Pacearchaeota archaeon]MBD3283649.1 hypothetical protein [Candidatus Pacearchaeota archaeon]
MGILKILFDIIIPLTLVAAILITIIWVLNFKNKKISKLLESERRRFQLYKEGVKSLQQSPYPNPRKNFDALNKYARAFFKEYLKLDYSLTYLELEKHFRKNNKNLADFCKKMSDINYTGGKDKKEEIEKLAKEFNKILESY